LNRSVVYKQQVLELRQTETFRRWRLRLKDGRARALIASRLDRLAFGHAGDAKAVGAGVFELRVHFGPGYRVYYARRGDAVILLLCGGDKGSQTRDIAMAKRMLAEME
jgi:putative addiction module killer protein